MNPFDILDQPFPQEPTRAERHWSDYQIQVFDWTRNCPDQNLLIQAVAGSGKTTTIIEAMSHAEGSSLFMAFNRAIAEDIRQKATSGDVKTLNALGHSLWKRNKPSAQLEPGKLRKILQQLMSSDDQREYAYAVSRSVGLAKNNAFGIERTTSVLDFEELMDAYDLNIPRERLRDMAQVAFRALDMSAKDLQTFDYDDQLYQPLLEGWEYPIYSNAFIDECQDLSPIQHLMLEKLHSRGARIIAVGDRRQAIYGFRGAMTDSMDALKGRFDMQELPLSISYRCALSVIREAQKLCSHIEAREGAPEGSITQIGPLNDEGLRYDPELFGSGMVLCRNNAPMFRAILRHVRAKAPCKVLTSFLDSFQGFIRGFKTETTQALRIKLDAWYMKEKEAAEKKGFMGKLMALEDKYETTKMLCEDYAWTEDVLDLVKRLANGTSGPTFATIHKAKGLEDKDCYLLRPDLIPSRFAVGSEQITQEENLLYVAITRAKLNFSYGERWT